MCAFFVLSQYLLLSCPKKVFYSRKVECTAVYPILVIVKNTKISAICILPI
jgi:hypothetical protein